MTSATVFDAAQYILSKQGTITTMKLQKLLYYGQAWHLAWHGKPLFKEHFEAWANGPVVRSLYAEHRGKYAISAGNFSKGDATNLAPVQIQVLDSIIQSYGPLSASKLSLLTHSELPWQAARKGSGDGSPSSAIIEHAWMKDFYKKLQQDAETTAPADVEFPAWA